VSGACSSASGHIACHSERLWRTSTLGEIQDELNGVVQADPPAWVHHDRSSSAARAHPAGDDVVADTNKTGGADAVRRPWTLAGERSVSDAHRRQLEDGTEVDGEPGSSRVVGPGGVDEQHLRFDGQTAHRRLKNTSDARSQEAGDVRRRGLADSQALVQQLELPQHHGGCPGTVSCASMPRKSPREAHPAAADEQ
jgi:hypothetical protein